MERKQSFEDHLSRLASVVNIGGKRIVEIGGDRWEYTPKRLVEEGADYVETINISPWWPETLQLSGKIGKRQLDCRELSRVYEPNSIDIVFGVAVGEHITGIDKFLEEAAKVLKPEGILYLHGGSIWTSTRGHHVWYKVGKKLYAFTDKDCPIQRWEHLMHDRRGLAESLKGRGLLKTHAEKIAKYIYTTTDNNRYGYNQLCAFFDDSPLQLLSRHDNAFFDPNDEERKAIEAAGNDPSDRYDITGVTHIMIKQ